MAEKGEVRLSILGIFFVKQTNVLRVFGHVDKSKGLSLCYSSSPYAWACEQKNIPDFLITW